MACKQESSVVIVDGFASKTESTQPAEKSDGDRLSQHVENVVRTWAFVKKDLVGNGIIFYMRLFSENPEVKGLFSFASNIHKDTNKDDPSLQRQAKMLMSMIDYAIRCLGNLEELVPKLKRLGKRHFVKYRVRPEHFEPVGAAFLWTLKEGLGELYTSDVEAAWTAIFGILADVMIEGGKEGLAETATSTGDE